MYKIDGARIEHQGRLVAEVRAEIFDAAGRKLGSFKANTIYDSHGRRCGSIRNQSIYDDYGALIATSAQLKRFIDGGDGILAAAAWFLIARSEPRKL